MKIFYIIIILVFLNSCSYNKSEDHNNKDVQVISRRHFNVLIVPDLSNRLNNKMLTVNDDFIVQQFISMLYPEMINDDSKIYQNDIFKLDFINKLHMKEYNSTTFEIDLSRFNKDQLKRNEYLGINEQTSQFKSDTAAFVKNFKKLISSVQNTHGSDIYGYLENLSITQIDTNSEDIFDSESNMLIHSFHENVIIFLTDGYIELGDKNDWTRSLSEDKINNFRRDYFQNGNNSTIEDFLEKNREKYAIHPVNNKLLKSCKILVLQLFDRGKGNSANKNERLPDLYIIKSIWKDWFLHSGLNINDFELYSCDDTYDEASIKKIFRTFLKLKKQPL